MSRASKVLLHGSLTIAVLLGFAWLYADGVVGRAIERGGQAALGVETDVDDVDLGIAGGYVEIRGLEIANPEGFEGERFLELGRARAEVAPRTLLEDTIVIPQIVLEDIGLSLEGTPGRTNYGALLGHASGGRETREDPGEGGKKLVIEELIVRGVRARVSVQGLGRELAGTEVEIPEIVLRDLGKGGGLELAAVIARVVREIATAVSRQQPGLSGALGGELRGQVDEARGALEHAGEGFRQLLRRDE